MNIAAPASCEAAPRCCALNAYDNRKRHAPMGVPLSVVCDLLAYFTSTLATLVP